MLPITELSNILNGTKTLEAIKKEKDKDSDLVRNKAKVNTSLNTMKVVRSNKGLFKTGL
jgi:hypothetical protein